MLQVVKFSLTRFRYIIRIKFQRSKCQIKCTLAKQWTIREMLSFGLKLEYNSNICIGAKVQFHLRDKERQRLKKNTVCNQTFIGDSANGRRLIVATQHN